MDQLKPQLKSRILILPLLLYFLISYVSQLALGVIVIQGEIKDYLSKSEVYQSAIESIEENATYSEISTTVEELLNEEGMKELLEKSILLISKYAIYSVVFTALVCIPVFLSMMKSDKIKYQIFIQEEEKTVRASFLKHLYIPIGAIALHIALNNIFTLGNLSIINEVYQKTSADMSVSKFLVQLVGLGILVPVSEELLFRGVVYRRLKFFMKLSMAMLCSALAFAWFQSSAVQGIYAFISTIVFTWLYEEYKTMWAPIIAHVCMSVISIILTQYDLFLWIFEEPMRMGMITVLSAFIASSSYVLIKNTSK